MKTERFTQTSKEALWGVGLFIVYFLWWYGFGYGLGSGDPAEYTYVLGLPAWFFWSCVAGFVVFFLVSWGIVCFFFKDMPLDDNEPE